MTIKITTPQQVTELLIGDVLLKCSMNQDPREMNDEQNKKHVEAYEIKYINSSNQMMYLVAPASSRVLFASPGDVGRLFIMSGHLITENVWWLQ